MGMIRSLMVVGALAGLLACAGPEVRYDFDSKASFASYRTFAWQAGAPGGAARGGGFDNAIMNGRIQRAVEAALAAKGFTPAAGADPDFQVNCYPVRQGGRSRPVHLGLGLGLGPVGLGVGAPVGSGQADAMGGIVIEIKDFQTRKVVWKATADRALESSDSPEEADRAVKNAVNSLFKRFPPPVK